MNVYLEIDGNEKGFRQLKCEARQHEMEQLLATQLCPIGKYQGYRGIRQIYVHPR